MTAPVPIEVAIIGTAAAGIGAIIKGAFDYVTANRKQIKDLQAASSDRDIKAWEQWRADNAELRREIAELRSDIVSLRLEIKDHEKGRERAEEACERLKVEKQIERDGRLAAEARAADYQKKYEGEQAISALFAGLYEAAKDGKQPDTALMSTIETQLRASGYLTPLTKGTPPHGE